MKTLAICLILLAAIVGCAEEDPGLPRGYSLLCSPEGKFALKSDEFGCGRSANVWNSAIEAKKFAWYWEKIKNNPAYFAAPSRKYEWSDCGGK